MRRTREERHNPQSAARTKRLAAALRENLRRRKEQARGRGSQSGGQGGGKAKGETNKDP